MLPLFLSGCVTYPDITQSRSPCRTDPGGWCGFVREAAVAGYPYAIASTNAYVGDNDTYDNLGHSLVAVERLPIAEGDADKGFDYQIFEQYEVAPRRIGWFGQTQLVRGERPIARVLAFRGTDFDGLTDIFYGSVRDDQIEIALRHFNLERERHEDGIPWIVAGHSLGGALATEVSIAFPRVEAWAFNLSPFYRGDAMQNDANRTVINERGELLQQFRRFRSVSAANQYILNCQPQEGGVAKHKIRKLADCITWIAAYENRDALAVVTSNEIPKPSVECGAADKIHPGVSGRNQGPCIHDARPLDDN
ncbi:MAG: hypothetical protein ABJO41_07280 [Erythrobacter sp.]